MGANRVVSYQWRLREVMAAHGLFTASDLVPLLAERGISLSGVQVWRLVTQTPERLSLPVLAALCDIFEVTAAQLIATRAENAAPVKKTAAAAGTRTSPTWRRSVPNAHGCDPNHDRPSVRAGDLPAMRRHSARLADSPPGMPAVPRDRTVGTAPQRRR